jgi:murein DD-endopeptidase MepM/ murein hydrolase activator NlpD
LQTAFHGTLFLLRAALVAGVAASGATGVAGAAEAVRPGEVVRWPGTGLQECALGERTWQPLGDACYYPIDLLANGTLDLERRTDGTREVRRVHVSDYPYDVQRIELEDDTHVNLSPESLARVERENLRIGALWASELDADLRLPLSAPLASLPDGGRFGARRIINGEPRSPHTGVDYAAGTGTPVLAVADGAVRLAEEHFFAGNSVFVDHGNGLISMYFHLSEISVTADQRVRRGQTLGKVGATGRATGPHLHFALRWHGARIDPSVLLAPPERLRSVE